MRVLFVTLIFYVTEISKTGHRYHNDLEVTKSDTCQAGGLESYQVPRRLITPLPGVIYISFSISQPYRGRNSTQNFGKYFFIVDICCTFLYTMCTYVYISLLRSAFCIHLRWILRGVVVFHIPVSNIPAEIILQYSIFVL